ncbi:hypothetical protein BJX65DRAFT_264765 [Aspergillus insuetus]
MISPQSRPSQTLLYSLYLAGSSGSADPLSASAKQRTQKLLIESTNKLIAIGWVAIQERSTSVLDPRESTWKYGWIMR